MQPASDKIVTLVAGQGSVLADALVQQVAHAVNANRTEILKPNHAVDVFVPETDGALLLQAARHVIGDHPVDVFVQTAASRRKKFLIADMESTMIEQEMLDELAEMIGIGPKVADITRRAMNGELDFAAALRERVALLRGQPEALLHRAAERISFCAGAEQLVAGMKQVGAQCWLVSGGFSFFVAPVAKHLGFDRWYANELEIKDGVITGAVLDPILDKNSKRDFLEKACAELRIGLNETAAVGDGANDVPMLQACGQVGGLGIAYQAKPKVREVVPLQINHADLTAMLWAQGLPG